MVGEDDQIEFLFPPYQRHSDTSYEAAVRAAPDTNRQRRRVLACFWRHVPEGMTDAQVQVELRMAGSTERPRRVELVAAGLVRDSGVRRATGTGRSAVVWEIVPTQAVAARFTLGLASR